MWKWLQAKHTSQPNNTNEQTPCENKKERLYACKQANYTHTEHHKSLHTRFLLRFTWRFFLSLVYSLLFVDIRFGFRLSLKFCMYFVYHLLSLSLPLQFVRFCLTLFSHCFMLMWLKSFLSSFALAPTNAITHMVAAVVVTNLLVLPFLVATANRVVFVLPLYVCRLVPLNLATRLFSVIMQTEHCVCTMNWSKLFAKTMKILDGFFFVAFIVDKSWLFWMCVHA